MLLPKPTRNDFFFIQNDEWKRACSYTQQQQTHQQCTKWTEEHSLVIVLVFIFPLPYLFFLFPIWLYKDNPFDKVNARFFPFCIIFRTMISWIYELNRKHIQLSITTNFTTLYVISHISKVFCISFIIMKTVSP